MDGIADTSANYLYAIKIQLAGSGGQGDTRQFGNFLGEDCIIVAPDSYERSW